MFFLDPSSVLDKFQSASRLAATEVHSATELPRLTVGFLCGVGAETRIFMTGTSGK